MVVALEVEAGHDVYALSVDYGQFNRAELVAAASLGPLLGVTGHAFVSVSAGVFGGRGVAGEDVTGTAYVPARNVVFLSLALAYAETVGATRICIGAHADDVRDYPDCRPEFLSAFAAMAAASSPCAASIVAPLAATGKAGVVREAVRLGVPLDKTVTCYRGVGCGECNACVLRAAALSSAGLGQRGA